MTEPAKDSGIGQPVRRREDLRLVRGNGRYTADENLPGQVYAVMVRSPHAHARIRSIATADAKAAPGVLAVLTGADFAADGLKPIPHKPWSPHMKEAQLHIKGDEPPFEAPHYPLPTDKARFVGEAVAMVVAETVHAAKDGAERVADRLRDLCRPWSKPIAAARQDAPRVHDGAQSNVCFDGELGDAAATDAAFARAAHVTRFETWVQRITGVPMEPRAALADYDAADRPLHRLCRQWRRGAAEERSRHHARRVAGQSPRADAGRRRQFRHPRHDLCRIRADRLGGEETRPAR